MADSSVTILDSVPLDTVAYTPTYEESSPRAVVVLNGSRYVPLSYSITFNAHGATDSAQIAVPLSSNPDFSVELFRDASNNSPVYAEIYAGFPTNLAPQSTDISQLSRRFLGVVDTYTPTFGSDLVTFACRSLAAPLVDNKLTAAPQNMTSVQFVKQQAALYGLRTNIVLAPGQTAVTIQEMLGRDFIGGTQFNAALYNMRGWDVLLNLAQFDDVDVWVANDVLNYASPVYINRKTIDLVYGRDLIGISGTHAPQFNKNIQVEVRTYQAKTRISTTSRIVTNLTGGVTRTTQTKTVTSNPVFGTGALVATSTSATGQSTTTSVTSGAGKFSSGFTGPGNESGKERYIYRIPNLSPARANLLAQSMWRQISQHEYSVDLEMPVTKSRIATFDVTALMKISGLPFQYFNDTYWPREIHEEFDHHGSGFVWTVKAVNHVLSNGSV